MKLDRRDFLQTSAGLAGLTLLKPVTLKNIASATEEKAGQSELAISVDVSKCIGCWWCFAACKNYNNLPEIIKPEPEEAPSLSPHTWTTLFTLKNGEEWSFRKQACMHCTDAACVKVCPTGALSNNELGFIKYEKDKCCGCGYCAEFCPFEVPQLENNSVTGLNQMNKCTFCVDRVTNGQQPACVEACPVDAIKFGTRADLLEEGKQRVEELKYTNPQACLYGENELGGLHVLYVLPDSPEIYGLPEEPKISLLASVEAKIFRPYAWIVWVAVAAGLAFNILIARKRELSKKEKK